MTLFTSIASAIAFASGVDHFLLELEDARCCDSAAWLVLHRRLAVAASLRASLVPPLRIARTGRLNNHCAKSKDVV